MIQYVQSTEKWEQWQRDYRLGLILILPPREVSDLIDPLRQKYDPKSHAICSTHISVSDPLTCEMTPALEGEIRASLSAVQPFELHFGELYASTEYAGVAYRIRPEEPVRLLQQALHASRAFGETAFHRRHIPPHMTIAEFISIQDSLRLCAQLQDSAPRGSFVCDELAFIVPDEEFRFRREMVFALGSG